MTQFRATIEGQRGEASRLGSKSRGIIATVNGWDSGVRVEANHSNGEDVFTIFATSGSNDRTGPEMLGTVRLVEGRVVFQKVGGAS